jgi:putative transcriptional regulator
MPKDAKGMCRLEKAIFETAEGMVRCGALDEEAFHQITMRHLPEAERRIELPVPSGEEIRSIRETAKMSQAVFAGRLNLTTGYISQLERGIRRPSGPTLVLLDLIRRRGIDVLT